MASGISDLKQSFDLKSGTTDSAAVSGYYDDWASTYDDTLKSWNYVAPSDAAARLAPYLAPGDAVLDIGCGTGLFGQAMAFHGDFSLVGLDISGESLQHAGQCDLYDRLTEHDLQKLPLPADDNSMAGAASVGVITYLEDAGAMLRDVCRCVKPGGVIVFTQRSDRWAEIGKAVEQIADEGLWSVLEISEPEDYLPGNEDFGEDIKVIYTVCKVT